jgi:hypothetical protein
LQAADAKEENGRPLNFWSLKNCAPALAGMAVMIAVAAGAVDFVRLR